MARHGLTGLTFVLCCREGINIFLAGFIPTENLRFREDSLTFKVTEQNAADEDVKKFLRFNYPRMTKSQGIFTLTVGAMPLKPMGSAKYCTLLL